MARKVAWWFAPHQWVGAHTTALPDLDRIPSRRVALVRYERLVADPTTTLRDLCRACDLSWGARESELMCDAAHALIQPVDQRWARLPRYQRQYILRVIGPLQRELGYPVEL
jgi:hypothetical protein